MFADRGLDASLDQVAAHAGVGVGTVYRRYPAKDALIDALFEERIDEIAAAGQRALSASDPWEGLVGFIQQANALQARDGGLKQALLSRGKHKTERAREKIVPIATELVARAQQVGALRADLDRFDLPLIDLMVSAIADITREASPELWQRAPTIIIDGLATTRQAPTPYRASRSTATNSPPSPSPSTRAPDAGAPPCGVVVGEERELRSGARTTEPAGHGGRGLPPPLGANQSRAAALR